MTDEASPGVSPDGPSGPDGPHRRFRSRRRLTGRAAAILTAVLVVAVVAEAFFAGWLFHNRSSAQPLFSSAQVGGPSETSGRYPGALVLPTDIAKPNVTLTDTAGKPYDLATATAGRVTLVYFGYTHCPDVCPINMALTAAALRDMPAALANQVTVAFVTTDPRRDTPSVIRAWLDNFNPSFVGLTGPISTIEQAEQQVGMPASFDVPSGTSGTGYQVEHAGYTLVYSQSGVARLSVSDDETAAAYAKTLENLVQHGFQA